MTGLVRVALLELPLHLHDRSRAHTDGLVREFRLLQEQPDETAVPTRLLQLLAVLQDAYGGVSGPQTQALDEAIDRGDDVLDALVYEVPPDAVSGAQALLALLEEADLYCRQGKHLLMVAAPPDVARYRSWYLGEFVRQAAGERATPWPAHLAAAGD